MKRTFIISANTLFLIFMMPLMNSCLNHRQDKSPDTFLATHYIFDKSFRIEEQKPAFSENEYLFQGMVTSETIDLFTILEQKFSEKSLNELEQHFSKVRQYLYTRFKEADAQKLFGIYQNYLYCQIELANNEKFRLTTHDPKEMLKLLYMTYSLRSKKMGKENADMLFGKEMKKDEYFLRRYIVISDTNLYGKEKENRLQRLKSDMWGDEVITIGEGSDPYNRYQLKQQLYQKDLAELNDKDRKIKIEEFKKEFFTAQQINRMHAVDKQIARERENLERYRVAKKKILDANELTQEEKNEKIRDLQNKFFGKDAEGLSPKRNDR